MVGKETLLLRLRRRIGIGIVTTPVGVGCTDPQHGPQSTVLSMSMVYYQTSAATRARLMRSWCRTFAEVTCLRILWYWLDSAGGLIYLLRSGSAALEALHHSDLEHSLTTVSVIFKALTFEIGIPRPDPARLGTLAWLSTPRADPSFHSDIHGGMAVLAGIGLVSGANVFSLGFSLALISARIWAGVHQSTPVCMHWETG